jgi:hypothetical protein
LSPRLTLLRAFEHNTCIEHMHSSLWLQVVDTCIQYEACTYASDWISVLVVDSSAQQPKRGEAYSSTSSMRAKDTYRYASANITSTGAATGIGPTMRPQTAIARSVAKPEPVYPPLAFKVCRLILPEKEPSLWPPRRRFLPGAQPDTSPIDRRTTPTSRMLALAELVWDRRPEMRWHQHFDSVFCLKTSEQVCAT